MIFSADRSYHGFLHRLHPATKLVVGSGFGLSSLFLKDPYALGLLCAFVLGAFISLRPRLTMARVLPGLVFLSFFALVNWVVAQSASHAATYTLRLVVFVLSMSLFSLTTSPQDLCGFLSQLAVPSGVMVSLLLAWRFFPQLSEEFRRIRLYRSLGSPSWSPWQKFFRGMLVPFVFFLFDYADKISLTLELRGFSPDLSRTSRKVPGFEAWDAAVAAGAVGLLIACAVLDRVRT